MDKIKRVLCIISVMNTGGAETFLMKLYKKLDRSKYQMDFCVNSTEPGFYDEEIKSLGGQLFVIPCKSDDMRGFTNGLKKVIRENNYEYVLRVTSNAMGFYDLKVAKDAGAKVCIARSSNSSDGKGIKPWAAHRLGKFLFGKYVDVKIAPSNLAAIYTFGRKNYQTGKVHILHNAVDIHQYCFSEEGRVSIREEMGIARDAVVIGHIGRMTAQKNHSFLLNVFSKIKEKNNKAVLLLIGEGELKNEVTKTAETLGISDSVIFGGIRSDIPNILSAMDVFVFPSLYEGMPNTVIEAQATGLPCVISDAITREADITGLVSYVSLENTFEDWAQETLQQLTVQRCSQNEKFVENKYDIESIVRDFEQIVFE